MSPDDLRESIFRLLYHPHGGSGLSATPEWVMGLEVADLKWYSERLDEARSREAEALRKAARSRKRGRKP